MPNLRHILSAARIVVVVGLAALFIKAAPTLVNHAADHSSTYNAPPAAAVVRAH
jgi:hypothetical protein